MTQNEKDLLLQDICSRLPYGVVVATTDNDGTIPNFWSLDMYNRLTEDVRLTNCEVDADSLTDFCDVRPYLFPLSSMTEEHKRELSNICKCLISFTDWEICFPNYEDNNIGNWQKVVSWMYKNHYDINGLIPSGLANDATGKNIY